LHVRLDHDRKLFHFSCAELLVQLIESQATARGLRKRSLALFCLTVFHDVPGLSFIGDLELIARFRHALQTEHFHWSCGRRLFNRLTAVIKHGAHFSEHSTYYEEVPDVE